MKKIEFKKMTEEHLSLWERWITMPFVRDVWFIEGYEPQNYVHQKIKGNGYDYPFIIFYDDKPIGYIVCCDLFAYRTRCEHPKGLFTKEAPGTYCMDLFIGEEEFLDKGYGTEIVKAFVSYIFKNFDADVIFIDPAVTNKRAIRCYEKAGFATVRTANDGITNCCIMKIEKTHI